MKRYLIALIFPAFLAGCASSPSSDTQHTRSSLSDSATLNANIWQLREARDADGTTIAPLFVRENQPVQIRFTGNRITVSNTCNNMAGTFTLDGDRMIFSEFASTRKMCADPKIAALDHEVARRLNGSTTYRIDHAREASPALDMTTATGDTLKFSGMPTPATRYGTEGEIIFLEVSPQKQSCTHPLIQEKQCLAVRRVHYDSNGVKTGTPGPWQALYQDIEGYRFEPGIRNVLRIRQYKIANPPADAPDTAYVLDMVIESQTVPAKKPGKKKAR